MALLQELTNDQLTAIRSGVYQALQFVCLVPNTVVVRFQPGSAPSADVFAEITVGDIDTGDMDDIEEGQLVIFSTTSNHQATEYFRTRVRKVSGTSTLYCGENSQALTTSHYVTVIDTYEIQERLRRDDTRVDWDITFRKLRPVETALKSAYVLTNDETTWNETAVPVVMDADASSIDVHSWYSSNSNDVLNSGGTTATPDFTLEEGSFRWLTYTFEDDLGNSNYRKIPVWTVPRDYSNAIALGWGAESGELANVSFDPELGWTCSIPAFDGITTLLNRTFTVVACDEWYGGRTVEDRQSMHANINFIGYLQTESVQTGADEQHGQISEVQFTIESFGHQLARQNISPVTIIQKNTSAAAWDEIRDPTPGRMLTYRLTEYSTASTLLAIKLPDDDGSFIGDDLTLSTEKALDDLNFIGDVINAEIQFDITGKLELCRDLNYLNTTARNDAPVVATLTPADFTSQFVIDFEYGFTTSQVTINGGDYETAFDRYDLTEAIAPAVARYGEGDPFELSNQVLSTDSTQAEANAELAQRAANHLAANNPTWILRVSLKDQWHFLLPDVGAWFKFLITATDTVRGKTFTSDDRWQLVQIDVSTNSETGTREVSATFRHETSSTGASVRAAPIVNDPEADIVVVPAAFPSLAGGDLGLTGGFYYDTQDSNPPSEPNPAGEECENGGFRIRSVTGYETSIVAGNGELAIITTRGKGRIGEGDGGYGSEYDHSFSSGLGDWEIANDSTNTFVSGTLSGGRVESADNSLYGGRTELLMRLTMDSARTIDKLTIYYERVDGIADSFNDMHRFELREIPGGSLTAGGQEGFQPNGDVVYEPDLIPDIPDILEILVWLGVTNNGTTAKIYLDRIVVTFVDAPPSEDVIGDSYYYSDDGEETWQAYDAGEGLLINSQQPDAIPMFNPNHEYEVLQTVDSGVMTLEFNSPFPTSEAENWSISATICLTGQFP